MTSDWVDIQFTSAVDPGELLGLLNDPDVQGAWQEGDTIHVYWPGRVWSPDHLRHLRQTLGMLNAKNVTVGDILVQSLPHQDWNQEWAQSVKALSVGKRILIRPSWETVAVGPGQIEIILDPKQAFGTGHHATTRMMLEWLEEIVTGGETVLDVGTGSGLLAMVALRLGAREAVGIDNDPIAIDCAKEYARVNQFGDELTLQCGTLDSGRPYDVVLANLDRGTLLALVEPLASCTGRMLLVSGLLFDQCEEITEAFARSSLYPAQRRERDGWVAMTLVPAPSCEGGER